MQYAEKWIDGEAGTCFVLIVISDYSANVVVRVQFYIKLLTSQFA